MKFHRLLILLAAAGAGTLVYKAQHAFTVPGTTSLPGQDIYSSLTGPGSLVHTIHEQTDARDAAIAERDDYRAGGNTGPMVNNYAYNKGGNGAYRGGGGGGSRGRGGAGGGAGRATQSSAAEETITDDFPLISAAAKGDQAAVEKRLSYHVKIDSRDNLRRTPLMYASWNGYEDICSRLLAAGANPEFRDREGNNVFDYAAGRGLSTTLQFLLARTHTTDDQHYGEYAQLIQAVFAGDASLMPQGTGKLASVNRINPEGQAPLHIASGNGSVQLMDALIQRGAQVNLVNSNRQTPLHWAAWNNQTAAIDVLLTNGADLTLTDLAGNSPLILAAQNGSTDAAQLLLKHGADRYAANKEGKTPAIVAEDNGYRDLASLLK